MKAYADLKRRTKPHNLNTVDTTLVKQRRHKASPHFEPVPYISQDVKGSMITSRQTTDQKEVTRDSSHFKKLENPPESSMLETELDEQPLLDFEGLEVGEPTKTAATQEEPDRSTPCGTDGHQDNTTPTTMEQPVLPPPVFSRSGRQIKKPNWTKDYFMT